MKKIFLLLLICNICGNSYAGANQPTAKNTSVGDAIVVISKGPDNWFAWCDIVENGNDALFSDQRLRGEMIHLLERIALARDIVFDDPLSKSGKSTKKWTGECQYECSECLDFLKKTVDSWHDERALKPLVDLGGSSYVFDSWEKALPLIKNRYHTANWIGKGEMIGMLAEMYARGVSSGSVREEIKNMVITSATGDKDSDVRGTAIRQLHKLGKDDALKILREMSKSDGYSSVNSVSKKTWFPIRETAISEIKRIEKMKDR